MLEELGNNKSLSNFSEVPVTEGTNQLWFPDLVYPCTAVEEEGQKEQEVDCRGLKISTMIFWGANLSVGEPVATTVRAWSG